MKVLFLDIDGVLNSWDNLHSRSVIWSNDNEKKSRDKYGALFDERCVRWLEYIVNKTNCKIVISSSWRKNGLKTMQKMWKDRKLPGEVIGITPLVANEKLVQQYAQPSMRGYQIQEWLDDNEVDKYCIVDDLTDILSHQIHIRPDGKIGLNDQVASKIIRILNGR